MKRICASILISICLLGCFDCEAETIWGIAENMNSDVCTLIELDLDAACCTRYDLPTSGMYLVADASNESVYLVRNADCGSHLFKLNEAREPVLKDTYSRIKRAFGFYDGWLYGTGDDCIARQKEDEYQELCVAPAGYAFRDGRNFKPAISLDGKVAYIERTDNGAKLCVVDPGGADPEPGTYRYKIKMLGDFREYVLYEGDNPRGDVAKDILWMDSEKVLCFRQSYTGDGQLYYEAIVVDTTDGRIVPVKLENGEPLRLENCTLSGLTAPSRVANDLYISMRIPDDPMWYMYNEVGVPFDIYRLSCDTGEKSVVLELDSGEYLINGSRLVVQ